MRENYFCTGEGSELKLSLKEAQSYAIQDNKMVLTAKIDVEASRIALGNNFKHFATGKCFRFFYR